MQLNIRGENMEITQALRDYADKKMAKLNKYFDTPPTSGAQITMNVIRDLQNVEVTIIFPGLILRAEERSSDMYASIDRVVDKLERQIRKHKTKINRKFRQDGSLKALFRESVENGAATIADDDDSLEVVRTKKFTLKPMDVEEAILQMNMVGHNFFVFSNMDSQQVNVVYKRDDGKYGLIEPAR